MSVINKLVKHFKSNADYVPQNSVKAVELFAQKIQAEYDSLCPKPSEFIYHNHDYETVEWNYIAISNAEVWTRFMEKPLLTEFGWQNVNESEFYSTFLNESLPLGIDWRLCCWSLDDAKRIHGEDE